jgi:hypothetical protein
MGAVKETAETNIQWNAGRFMVFGSPEVLSGAARDSGNTPTTILRAGLVLGKIASSGKLAQYDPTATDGTQQAYAFMPFPMRMTDFDANDVDRTITPIIGGFVKASQVPNLDNKARADLFGRVIFDDDLMGNRFGWRGPVAKAADYTVTAADNGTLFTTRGAAGAVNFTLPAIDRGLRYRFFNEAGQNMTITAATADTMVVFNDLAADSIAFSTASELIGGSVEVIANDNETKWLVLVNLGAETQTPTIAT